MMVFPEETVIILFNGLACMLFAASAAAKARSFGAHFTGALILGIFSGLSSPILCSLLISGQQGIINALSQYPDDALIGSVAGIALLYICKRLPVVKWLGNLAVSFATCLGAMLALRFFGAVGGMALGIITALVPGFIADAALGNIAEFVERDWYVTAAILGAVLAMAIFAAPYFFETLAFMHDRLLETSILSGTIFAFCLQVWKEKK